MNRLNCQLFLTIIICFILNVIDAAESYTIWPLPKNITQTDEFCLIDSGKFSINIKSKGWQCKVMERAIERYKKRMFAQDCSLINENFKGNYFINDDDRWKKFENDSNYQGEMTELTIFIDNICELIPDENMDETYQLEIDGKNKIFSIRSKSVWGSLRGLETFSQLIELIGKNKFLVNNTKIQDEPRFEFRGFLIDTSRHYLPIHSILEMLDAMELNKFNILHWHIVDDQSFPYVSETYPNLSKFGSFRNDFIYNHKDIEFIIDYASDRGIRVLPEFDSPGHTQSWGLGQSNLLTQCYDENGTIIHNKFGPINPEPEETYEFLRNFFEEITQKFPEKFIHLGGDEVNFDCWKNNPQLQKFMMKKNFGNDYAKLESYYMEKLLKIFDDNFKNKSYIVWQEVFDHGDNLTSETIVDVWISWKSWQDVMFNVTKNGYRTILSAPWYLNKINYGTQKDWHSYYDVEPLSFHGSDEQNNLVIGGEACMWGEFVDATNLIPRTWPRGSAVAERLWSEKSLRRTDETEFRFRKQRCRMQLYGVKVQPIFGPDLKYGPDVCLCDNAF